MHLGWSSCVYPLLASDFASVPDYEGPAIPASALPADEVILLIRKGASDCLVRGREKIRAAEPGGTVGVRVVFVPTIAKWNILSAIVRPLRDRRRFMGTGVYHIAPKAVRALRVERAVRTVDNPQARRNEDRQQIMDELKSTLQSSGYDDTRPIDVMLCRSRGEDSLRQGHHRISACLAYNIPLMTICFSAAAALPTRVWRLIGRVPVRFDVLKGALESQTGAAVARIVPLGDKPAPRQVLVVPKAGGRYVLTLETDKHVSVGIARAIIMPALVAIALAFDVFVLETFAGVQSVVAWCQVLLMILAAALIGEAAVREPRGRAGFCAAALFFLLTACYELFYDVLAVHEKAFAAIVSGVLVVLVCVVCALVSWRTFKTGLKRIAFSAGFPALPFGIVTVWGFSEIVSSEALWGSLTTADLTVVKRVVEEAVELFGYAMMTMWAVSFFWERQAYRGRR